MGSNASDDTYPWRGCTDGHVVVESADRAAVWCRTKPSLVPASARSAFAGWVVTADTEPLPGRSALALVHTPAWSVVRQRNHPPVNSTCGFAGAMWKGAMKRKPPSEMPVTVRSKVAPPSVDFLIDSLVFSANRTSELVGS